MLFAGGEGRRFSGSDLFQRLRDRHGVLSGVLHAGDAADGVGVPLADSPPPEGIIRPVRQDSRGIKPVQGEKSRIPAARDQSDSAACLRRGVHPLKVFRDPRMGVKAVDHVEVPCQRRRRFGQVGSASAAEDQDVDPVLKGSHFRGGKHFRSGQRLHACGVAAGKNADELRIRILPDGAFHASSQIAVSVNGDSHRMFPFFPCGTRAAPVFSGRSGRRRS